MNSRIKKMPNDISDTNRNLKNISCSFNHYFLYFTSLSNVRERKLSAYFSVAELNNIFRRKYLEIVKQSIK